MENTDDVKLVQVHKPSKAQAVQRHLSNMYLGIMESIHFEFGKAAKRPLPPF